MTRGAVHIVCPNQLLEFRMSFCETISSEFLAPGNFKHTQFSRDHWCWPCWRDSIGLTNRLDFDFRWQDIYTAFIQLSFQVSFHVQFVSYLHLIVSCYWKCRKVTKKTFSFNHNEIKPMCSLTLCYPKGSTLKCKVMFQYIPSVLGYSTWKENNRGNLSDSLTSVQSECTIGVTASTMANIPECIFSRDFASLGLRHSPLWDFAHIDNLNHVVEDRYTYFGQSKGSTLSHNKSKGIEEHRRGSRELKIDITHSNVK